GLAIEFFGSAGWLSRATFAASIVAGGLLTIRRAWTAARVRSIDINVLMIVAAAGAIALGEWSEAAAVIFLFAVAQTLEVRTLERARSAIRALMDLTPSEALVRDGGRERRVDVDQLAPGALI